MYKRMKRNEEFMRGFEMDISIDDIPEYDYKQMTKYEIYGIMTKFAEEGTGYGVRIVARLSGIEVPGRVKKILNKAHERYLNLLEEESSVSKSSARSRKKLRDFVSGDDVPIVSPNAFIKDETFF